MRKKGKREDRELASPSRARNDAPSGASSASWTLVGVLAATAVMAGASTPVSAQSATPPAADGRPAARRFNVEAGPLDSALATFSRVSGIAVTDPDALASTARSNGAQGMLTNEDALKRIFGGTGITFRYTNGHAIRLERGEAPATQLSTVAVVGTRQQVSSPKYTAPLRDIPQTISVVPQEILKAQGVTTVRDAVRNVPGLTVNAGEGGATPGDNFNIRGFSARGDVFVDGVRDLGGYSRETFNIEQIEVSKGPGSAYSGRGSTGGSINLVTKAPNLQRGYSGVLGVGSADYQRATVDLNQPLDSMGLKGVAVRLNGMYQKAGVAGLPVIERNAWGIAPSIALGLGTSTQVTLELFRTKQDNIPTYGLQSNTTNGPPANIDVHQYFGLNAIDREDVTADQITAKVTHDFGGLTLRNTLAWGHTDAHRLVTYARPDATRNSASHITDDANITNQTNIGGVFHTGAVEHTTVGGLELSHEKSLFGSYHLSKTPPKVTDLNNANPDDAYTGVVTEGLPRRTSKANSVGLYAFETMKPSEKFELTGGLRWDYFSPTYRDSLARDITPDTAASHALTGRVGVVFKPVVDGSIYAAYGTSFNPSGELLAFDTRGNSGVKPEMNRTFELGVKWDLLQQRLSIAGAVFRTDKTNARMTNPDDPTGPQILAGFQRVKGVELSATGQPFKRLSVYAGWSFLDGEIVRGTAGLNHTPIVNTPKHSGSAWTTLTLPRDASIGAGLRFIDKRYWTATSTVPSYTAVDAQASMPLGRRVELQMNITNLTDRTYFDTGRYWVPAAGRAVKVSTMLKY